MAKINDDAARLVAAELIKRGVRPEVAAGAVAGVMGESGPNIDPTAFNTKDPGGGSGGFGQWNRERLIGNSGMLAFARNAGVSVDINNPQDAKKVPLAIQAQYLGHELDTSYSGVLKGLQSVTTGKEGLTTWVNNYENPADKAGAIAQRSQYISPVTSVLGTTVNTTPDSGAVAATTSTGATGTAAAAPPAGGGLFGVGAGGQATTDKATTALSNLDKAFGGKGLGADAQGGRKDTAQIQASPIIPGPGAHMPGSPGYPPPASEPYGQTLNSVPELAGAPQQPQGGLSPQIMAMLQQLAAQQSPQFPGGLV